MYRLLVIATIITVVALLHATQSVTAAPTIVLGQRNAQARAANGAGTILFPTGLEFNYHVTSAAFTPDGNVYFNFLDAGAGAYERFSPDGTFTKLVVPFLGGSKIIYSHGSLWSGSYNGVVQFSPDGTKHRDYYLGAPISDGIADGPNGSIFATSEKYSSATKSFTNLFFQVGGASGIKRLALPVRPLGPLAMGPDRNAWFSYEDDATSSFGIARIESNDAITLFPVTGEGVGLQPPYFSLIADRGALYFTFISAGPIVHEVFGRIAVDGTITELGLPFSSTAPLSMSADKGGNIWMDLDSGLFVYDTYNGKFLGPYAVDNSHPYRNSGPFVGLDNNVYFFESALGNGTEVLAVYTHQLQTLEPGRVVLTSGKLTQIAILETHANGPWTARVLDPSIATISSPSSNTGAFDLIGGTRGTTSIAVTDRLGNTAYGTVTTQ